MHRIMAFIVATVALGLSTSQGQAGFTARLTGANPTVNLAVNLTTPSNPSEPTGNFPVGQYNWQWTGGDSVDFLRPDNSFSTFCIEITQYIALNTNYTYNLVNLANAPQPGTGQGSGVTSGMGADRANMLLELTEKNFRTNLTANEAAAFQLAVWEIVYEGPVGSSVPSPMSVDNGAFTLTSANTAVRTLANAMLASVTGNGSYASTGQYYLQAMTSPGQQDQLVIVAAPAPPGLVLVVTGLFSGLAFRRFVRRSRPSETMA